MTSPRGATAWIVALGLACAALNQFSSASTSELEELGDLSKYEAVRRFSRPKKGAWVYPVMLHAGRTQYALTGLTISITSLLESGTQYEVVVVVDGAVDDNWLEVLKALGVSQVYHVQNDFSHLQEEVDIINLANSIAPDHYKGCFSKLLAWALTDFDKVISVDFDVVFWRNPDVAMLYPEVSAINDYGMSLGNPNIRWVKAFQAGIMVMQPNHTTARGIIAHLADHVKEGGEDTGDLPEQHVLNEYWNLRWFELPVGFNIMPTQIPYEAYKGVYSIHHVAWWKNLFYKAPGSCEEDSVDCKECCRRAVAARIKGEDKIRAAGLSTGRRHPPTTSLK